MELAFIGRPNDFIEELNNSNSKYIILSDRGLSKQFNMPELGEDVYETNEPNNIISEVIKEKINIRKKVIIFTACSTGSEELAKEFINKQNIYIAPRDDIEGPASLLFVIRFFYEHLVMNKSIKESFNIVRENDNETNLYKLFME
ncbi:MAG: delta-aminolevulinic acid dehydratase [Acholeplasmataceae bacterium]